MITNISKDRKRRVKMYLLDITFLFKKLKDLCYNNSD